jgi:hypothetical protein
MELLYHGDARSLLLASEVIGLSPGEFSLVSRCRKIPGQVPGKCWGGQVPAR